MIVSNAPLGFSIRSVGRGIKRAGRGVEQGVKTTVKYTIIKPTQWTLIKPTQWLAHQAARPIRHIVQKIVHRRAAKLAWDKRKSTTPNAAEQAEAKAWTKSKLNHELPHGPVLALFAGSPTEEAMLLGYDDGQLGVAPVVVAAAIPVLMALAQQLASRFSSSGEAPANPQADARGDAAASAGDAAASSGGGDGGGGDGSVDMTPVQDAAADAAHAAEQAASPNTVKLPGVGRVKRSHVMIGAAVLGGIVLLAVLTSKKS